MVFQRKSYSLADVSIHSKTTENKFYSDVTEVQVVSTSQVNKTPAKHNPFLGLFYTFATSVTITLASVMAKKLSYINISQLSLVLNAGVLVGSIPLSVYCNKEVLGRRKDRRLLVTRALLGATALYLNLTAYRYLPLAEAAIILSTAPALTTLIAHFYLKESCSFTQFFSLILTISGVLLSVRIPELLSEEDAKRYDITYFGGLAAAVSSVIIVSVTFVAMRKMTGIHFSLTMLYFGFFGLVENAIITVATATFEIPFCGWDLAMYVLIATLGFVENCTFTLSVMVQEAGIVSVLKASTDIIVAVLFQIIFFNENPDIYNISGACLVIISVTMMGIRNWLLMLPKEAKIRKLLKCFLH